MAVLTYLITSGAAGAGTSGPGYVWQSVNVSSSTITKTHIKVDASGGNIDIVLPAASSSGTFGDFIIKRMDSNTDNVVTITTPIDGEVVVLNYQFDAVRFSSDGTQYLAIP